MALFLRLRAVAVSNYRILCCPDFPLAIFQASDYIERANVYFNRKYSACRVLANARERLAEATAEHETSAARNDGPAERRALEDVS